MTIDVSTPEARQGILDRLVELRQGSTPWNKESVLCHPDDVWLIGKGEDAIEAAFARIDLLDGNNQNLRKVLMPLQTRGIVVRRVVPAPRRVEYSWTRTGEEYLEQWDHAVEDLMHGTGGCDPEHCRVHELEDLALDLACQLSLAQSMLPEEALLSRGMMQGALDRARGAGVLPWPEGNGT